MPEALSALLKALRFFEEHRREYETQYVYQLAMSAGYSSLLVMGEE